MNKIEQLIINTYEGYITFLVTFDLEVDLLSYYTLYIDEACNNTNIHKDDPNVHNYIIDNTNSTITVNLINQYAYTIRIDSMSIRNYSEHLKYIRLITITSDSTDQDQNYVVAEGLYYNALIIYEAEIYNINKYCSTCLDDKNMQLIVYVTFRRLLLEDAILLDHYKEAMLYYLDLTRVLGIVCDFKLPSCLYVSTKNTKCTTCSNGSCSIC